MIATALLAVSAAAAAADRAARPAAPPPARSPAPIAHLSRPALAKALVEQARRPLPRRIAFWSRLFLRTPYWVPPPGAVAPVGPDLHRVDCETFVEQVVALSLSRDLAQFPRQLRALRTYPDPTPTAPPRPAAPLRHRHFTVVRGWLAHNRAAGRLQDITRQVGGAATRTLTRSLDPVGWSPRYLRRFYALGVAAPLGTARIAYIPWRDAIRLASRVPHGAVVHVVAAAHPRTPYLVTHVGFAIAHPRWGRLWRHASQSPGRRRVEDRPFGPYLYYISHTPAGPEMRTGLGIHVSRVVPPEPRSPRRGPAAPRSAGSPNP